ncbi:MULTISPECIES: hypothetical protein [Sellimonas]|uniref:Zn-finger containing protein n=1 Tax=Sellimonas caecigallum TaxID=2592333 RepID=A0ABS7L620_9FIRM|nr:MULTISPECIES: hypothetical protein [Sellimonas]MBY0758485.1 hypothetical protein [Sellimonas caecigallum]OUO99996.1 hypothetical protein B5F37_12750 [Drancourtella sp. An210]OUP63830.1 hypothetical protein B5F13_09500 [Drancourtella sp. An177]
MKDKFMRFMYGRYGVDSFSKFLVIAGIILLALSGFFEYGWILYLLSLVLLAYSYFRIFSKNHSRRYAENQTWLKYTSRFRRAFGNLRYRVRHMKSYHIYKCPSCSQKIRIPRGKGRIEIRCPKCGTKFIKNS